MLSTKRNTFTIGFLLSISFSLSAQNDEIALARAQRAVESETVTSDEPTQKVIVVTGARFSYKLVEKWIDDYNKVNPNV